MGDNGKKFSLGGMEFTYFIMIGMNDDGKFAMQTNVPARVMGYGMLEEGKAGVERHIRKLQEMNRPRIQRANVI